MSAEPLFVIVWRDGEGPGEPDGRTTKPRRRLAAETVAAIANRTFPDTSHWIEEAPAHGQ